MMDNMNFVPYWYHERKTIRRRKMFRLLLILILAFDALLIYIYTLNVKEYKHILKDIGLKSEEISLSKNNAVKKIGFYNKMDKFINIFQDSIQGKIQYSSIDISNDKIDIKIPATGQETLINSVNILGDAEGVDIVEIESGNNNELSPNFIRIGLRAK